MVKSPTRLSLARTPTPLQPLPTLSEAWGIDLWVKRDDLTGAELSGNKIRKLEYLLADAESQQCDVIITTGAITSNHTRAATLAARKRGLDAHLLLAGKKPPAQAQGNLQLELLAGARVHYITWREYRERIDELLRETAQRLRDEGRNPYIIPTGGSNEVGLWGYVNAFDELNEQCHQHDINPDAVVCAVGSGGTYAGLCLGNAMHQCPTHIYGVIVCNSNEYFAKKVHADLQAVNLSLDQPIDVPPQSNTLVDGYVAGGYAQTNEEQLRFLRTVAQKEALILDPVYTNKALFGLRGLIQDQHIQPGSQVIFIHTGGIFGLPSFAGDFHQVWNQTEHWPN